MPILEVLLCQAARRGICVRKGALAGQCGAPDPLRDLPCCALAHTDLIDHIDDKTDLTILTDNAQLVQIWREGDLLRQIYFGTISVFY